MKSRAEQIRTTLEDAVKQHRDDARTSASIADELETLDPRDFQTLKALKAAILERIGRGIVKTTDDPDDLARYDAGQAERKAKLAAQKAAV